MSKTYLPCNPDQQLLLPAALQKWLPDDHLAYFISDVVDQLDLSDITERYEGERRGGPPHHPRMMVKVLLYGYCVGVSSSRRIAQRLREDIAFRVLAANNTPDFRTISDFRKDNLDALSGLFLQVKGGAGRVHAQTAGYAQHHAQTWLPLARYDSASRRSCRLTFKTVAIGRSWSGVGLLSRNHYPRCTGALSYSFSTPQHSSLRWIGA